MWVRELEQFGPPNIVLCMAGNKADLSSAREIATEVGQSFATEIGALFTETSAKADTNVHQLFVDLCMLRICVFRRVMCRPKTSNRKHTLKATINGADNCVPRKREERMLLTIFNTSIILRLLVLLCPEDWSHCVQQHANLCKSRNHYHPKTN